MKVLTFVAKLSFFSPPLKSVIRVFAFYGKDTDLGVEGPIPIKKFWKIQTFAYEGMALNGIEKDKRATEYLSIYVSNIQVRIK